jgi:hypothetical protein
MRLALFVRKWGLFVVLGFAGFGGGCGPEAAPSISAQESAEHKAKTKAAHQEIRDNAKKAQAEAKQQAGATRKEAHHKGG